VPFPRRGAVGGAIGGDAGGGVGARAHRRRGDRGRPAGVGRGADVTADGGGGGRSLAYHSGLRELAGSRLDLLVLTSADRTPSTNANLARLANVAVQGLPLNISVAVASGVGDLRALVRSRHIEAFDVDALAPALYAPLRASAREPRVVVCSSERSELDTVTQVAVVDEQDRARIVVSLPELRAAQVEFVAGLLKLCEVVR